MVWQGHLRSVSLALLYCAASTACASSGFDGRVYHNGDLRFRVGQIPTAWRSIDVDDALDEPAAKA